MARESKDNILALLEDPRVKPSLISMLVVGVALGYAIKIAVDSFRKINAPSQT